MKLGILSDTHGDADTLAYVLNHIFQDVNQIIHAGDILYGAEYDQIKRFNHLLKTNKIPFIAAEGNCDRMLPPPPLHPELFSPYGTFMHQRTRIVFTHGDHYSSPLALKLLADSTQSRIIITGHTHIFQIDIHNELIFLNPGSPARPKHPSGIPTVMKLENNTLELINAKNGNILEQRELKL